MTTPRYDSFDADSLNADSLNADSLNADSLNALRARLDGIDVTLLDTLRQRIGICVEIAVHKREHGVPMMQPHRIGLVQRRAAEYGAEHGIDTAFLRRLYDLIIAETCRVEDEVIGASA